MSYSSTNWPPLQTPPVNSSTKTGGIAAQPATTPSQIVQPTAVAQTWTAAARPANTTSYESPVITQRRTNAIFGIVNAQLNSEAP